MHNMITTQEIKQWDENLREQPFSVFRRSIVYALEIGNETFRDELEQTTRDHLIAGLLLGTPTFLIQDVVQEELYSFRGWRATVDNGLVRFIKIPLPGVDFNFHFNFTAPAA